MERKNYQKIEKYYTSKLVIITYFFEHSFHKQKKWEVKEKLNYERTLNPYSRGYASIPRLVFYSIEKFLP